MKKPFALQSALLCGMLALSAASARAAAGDDVIFRRDGTTYSGAIKSADSQFIRLDVQLQPGQPKATISIPLANVQRVDFGETEALQKYLDQADASKRVELERAWLQRRTLLALPNSLAGAFALKLAELHLKSDSKEEYQKALDLVQVVETGDWNTERRVQATELRIRSMVKLGRASEAIEEAKSLSQSTENPEVMIEAKFVLADARVTQLRKLEEDNPRWDIDERVRPERNRLYNEALDLFLYPYLFHGARAEESARGLWSAIELYQFAGENTLAAETAKDIAVLYPKSEFATAAKKLLSKQPKSKTDES